MFRSWVHFNNPTTVALTYLLIILISATVSRLWVAIAVCLVADVSLNYFFLPPVGTLAIAEPQNWVALFVFLAVSLIASNLSAAARERTALAVERAELLEERKNAEMARKSEQLKSALLASLGHDLRTPLTAIRVAASNLQASWLADSDRREQSDLILAEVERLNRLFQNILEMARIEAGAVSAEVRWVFPSEIFDAARNQVEHTLRQHRVELATDSDRLVRLDPRLTASALAHLLENAAQYTPAGSTITVTMATSSDGLSVKVRDRGPGIAPADVDHLFEKFYRGADARRVSGTGMGLSIARGMIGAERGRIWVENCPDGGAEFTIAVPADSRAAELET